MPGRSRAAALQEWPWLLAIVAATLAAFTLNIYGLLYGITIVLPHLIYLPIVIAAYRFPRWGVPFAILLGTAYLGIVYAVGDVAAAALVSAASRAVVFVAIGAVVAYLSLHLKEQEERYRGLFENSEAGSFLVRLEEGEWRIEEANQRGAELLGYTQEQLAGRPIAEFWGDREGAARLFDRIAREKQVSDQEATLVRADGREVQSLLSAGTLSSGRLILTLADITERKIAEDALHAANEKLNLLGSLTRSDLLASVNRISETLEGGERQFTETAMLHFIHTLQDLARSLQRRIELTRDYQDLGREPPAWQYAQGLIRKEAESLDLKGISLRPWVERLEVYADSMLGKVFHNLLDDSVRHGRTVSEIVITYHRTDDGLDLYYEDDGIGIPDASKKAIFEHRSDGPSGFGLFLSREILGITGMEIEECGEHGKGARFVIHIPAESYRIM